MRFASLTRTMDFLAFFVPWYENVQILAGSHAGTSFACFSSQLKHLAPLGTILAMSSK
jgi:hypothetical protein